MMCIFLPIIIELGVWLIVLKEHRVEIGFLLCVPVSLLLGYILPVRDNKQDKSCTQILGTALTLANGIPISSLIE